jgi:hypothetical protein
MMTMARYRPRKRFKRCYELTWEFLAREDDRFIGWRIVHGMVDLGAFANDAKASGVSIDHAWLESDDQVYDTTLDRTFAKDDYYRQYGACSLVIYTAAEAARLVLDEGHYGPWRPTDEAEMEFRRAEREASETGSC